MILAAKQLKKAQDDIAAVKAQQDKEKYDEAKELVLSKVDVDKTTNLEIVERDTDEGTFIDSSSTGGDIDINKTPGPTAEEQKIQIEKDEKEKEETQKAIVLAQKNEKEAKENEARLRKQIEENAKIQEQLDLAI